MASVSTILTLLAIVGDPSQHGDPYFVAHMINDGARLTQRNAHRSEAVEIYTRISLAKENSVIMEELGCALACKPIARGEELFYSYGAGYWRNQL